MGVKMTQLQEAIGKLQDERIDMEQQREEKMTKQQDNMDTLREVRDAMESKPNDLIVPTNNDNVQQEQIDNFDSNRLETIVVKRTSLDTEESSKAPIMVIKAPIVLASVPVGVQTPATAADITIRVDSAKTTRTAATTTEAGTSCNRHRLIDSTSPLPTPFHLQSNLSGVRSSLFSPQQEGQPIPQHHQQMHQHQQLHDQQLHTRETPLARTPCLAFTHGGAPDSVQSMDDRLERIKFASERAMRTLKNITNTKQKLVAPPLANVSSIGSASKVQVRNQTILAPSKSMSLDETEAIVRDVLNSCGD